VVAGRIVCAATRRARRSEFDPEAGRLDLYLEFLRGSRFACPNPIAARRARPVQDTEDKDVAAPGPLPIPGVPAREAARSATLGHGVRQVTVRLARPGSGFTLLFEALLITFAGAMPVAKVATFTGEHNTRIWRVLSTMWKPSGPSWTSARCSVSAWM
jgi:transposase